MFLKQPMEKAEKRIRKKRILLAAAGIALIGIGVSFNAAAALGNDAVGIVYDGIRNAANFSPRQLGMASNIVNVVMLLLIFFLDKHYINIGTFMYSIPYGTIVDLGDRLYHAIFPMQTLPFQIMGAAIGCFLLYVGVAMFIVADIGVDPFTGIVLIIRDKVKKEYRIVKVCFDVSCILLGVVLGGRLGVITILTALTAGPMIQRFADIFRQVSGETDEQKDSR